MEQSRRKCSNSKALQTYTHAKTPKFWALALLLASLISTGPLSPALAQASEVDDLKLLAACVGRDAQNRFGPNRTLLAEQLSKLNVYLAEDRGAPFFDDLSLALLLRHFRQSRPEQPIILAAPQGKWRTQDNPELASPIQFTELESPASQKLSAKARTSAKVIVLGRNAFENSLKNTIENLQHAYAEHPEIFADPKNTLTFDFENSLTQRLDALTLSPSAYKKKMIATYQVQFPETGWSADKEKSYLLIKPTPTTPLKDSEIKALDAIFQDLPSSWSTRVFKGLKISRAQNGAPLTIPDAVALYSPITHEILLSDKVFENTRSEGLNTLSHELGHVVANALKKSDSEALNDFFQISWRGKIAISPRNFVSGYASTNPDDDFAETFALFTHNSAELKKKAPPKYEWMKRVLFPDREYFPVYPKNAQIQISSTCEDDIPPTFSEALNLKDAIQLSCEVDPNDPDQAQIVARISGIVETGTGISENSDNTRFIVTGKNATSHGSYSGSVTQKSTTEIEIRTPRFQLSSYAPDTELRLTRLEMTDRSNNRLVWDEFSPMWDAKKNKWITPKDLDLKVSIPGTKQVESPMDPKVLSPRLVSVNEEKLLITLSRKALETDSIVFFFSSKTSESLYWRRQVNLKYFEKENILPVPNSNELVQVQLSLPQLPDGTYDLHQIDYYSGPGEHITIPLKEKKEFQFNIANKKTFKELSVLAETLTLQEERSTSPNQLGGDTSIQIDVDLSENPQYRGMIVLNLLDPSQKMISCYKQFSNEDAAKIHFACPLPQGHLAGVYSVDSINTWQTLGEDAHWINKLPLARQGIRKTIEVKDLMPEQKSKPLPVQVNPEL